MEILDTIRQFAADAHQGQTRKYTPDPYIVHPIRVMETCRAYGQPVTVQAAALLHDVIEDTPITERELSDFLNDVMSADEAAHTHRMVVELTDVYVKSAYPKLNRRTRKDKELARLIQISADAQTVKYADIMDNVREIPLSDPGFAPRYLQECRAILKRLDKGHPVLRQMAMEAVEEGMAIIAKK